MRPKKIILIVIDTLRADHLGCYGYERKTSPNIDEFAKKNVKFEHAFSASSYTLPSIASIFTGKYPSNHSVGFDQTPTGKLNTDRDITLAEILSSNGYRTAGFVSTVILRKETNIDRGFQTFNDELTGHEANNPKAGLREGDKTNGVVFNWLDKNYGSDFFLFVHYMDVHGPYVNSKKYSGLFLNDELCKNSRNLELVPDGSLSGIPEYQVLSSVRTKNGKIKYYEKKSSHYIAQYDSGIRCADDLFGRLIKKLESLGIYDESLIILTSDHGESLGENDVWFFHGMTVTKDQIHVPLIIKPHQRMKLDTSVSSLTSLSPFILNLAGIDYTRFGFDSDALGKKSEKEDYLAEIETQKSYIFRDQIYTIPKIIEKNQVKYTYYHEELLNKEIIYPLGKSSDAYSSESIKKARDEFMKNLFQHISKKNKEIAELKESSEKYEELKIKIQKIEEESKKLESELKNIRGSKSWRIIQTYGKIIKKIGL